MMAAIKPYKLKLTSLADAIITPATIGINEQYNDTLNVCCNTTRVINAVKIDSEALTV